MQAIVRLQAWARGVVTRERIRAQLSELNPQHNYYMSNPDGALIGFDGDPNFNMQEVDES